jgi:hypothetical protein
MKYYKQSGRKETSYIQHDEGRLTGLVTSCVEAAFYTKVFKERLRGGEDEEVDVSSYWITLRKRKITGT